MEGLSAILTSPKFSVLQINRRSQICQQQKPINFHISQVSPKEDSQKNKSKRLVELVSYSAKETVEDKE